MNKNKYKRTLFIIGGSFCLVLGALGIILPLLPTTPLWLLSAWMFMHGSEKIHHKLMSIGYFGDVVRNYQIHKALPLYTKISSVLLLWISISISAFYIDNLWVRIILLIVAIGVSTHILSYKTLKKQ